MKNWPGSLMEYRFNAHEVEQITGVTNAVQRQWRVRYLDFRLAQFVVAGELGRGEWSWEGVQLIALFAQALADLSNGKLARDVLMIDPQPGITTDPLGIYHGDYRRLDDNEPDLLIVGDLAEGGTGFGTMGACHLERWHKNAKNARFYLVNFSAFQRELYNKMMSSIDLVDGPGALPDYSSAEEIG